MLTILEKKEGKFNAQFTELLGLLNDGSYVVNIRYLNPLKTIRDYQNEYFALVDAVRDTTGDTRYAIHEAFKKERKVGTTRAFNLKDWLDFIEAFKWYYFNKADILL